MKRKPSPIASITLLAGLVIAGCTKEFEEPVASRPSAPTEDPAATEAYSWYSHPGRTLAANCFQCHGTDGFAGELKIAGESYSELISELNGFRAKDSRSDIMNFHAKAYTLEEIELIADYFSKQK